MLPVRMYRADALLIAAMGIILGLTGLAIIVMGMATG
jgi:hypothetical protein